MTEAQERTLKACREVCSLLAEEALYRIDFSIVQNKEAGKPPLDPWMRKQQEMLLRLRRELEETGT